MNLNLPTPGKLPRCHQQLQVEDTQRPCASTLVQKMLPAPTVTNRTLSGPVLQVLSPELEEAACQCALPLCQWQLAFDDPARPGTHGTPQTRRPTGKSPFPVPPIADFKLAGNRPGAGIPDSESPAARIMIYSLRCTRTVGTVLAPDAPRRWADCAFPSLPPLPRRRTTAR